MTHGKTVGELSAIAARDNSTYCAFDVGDEMVKDIEAQVRECIDSHKDTFDSDQFCVVMLIARDRLLPNLLRRKFYAWPFLPKPRTSQTVWLYDKNTDETRVLWVLPTADTMATLSSLLAVDKAYKNMKRWSDYFYTTKFWQKIRDEHGITMLSEEEHLEVITKEGAHLAGNDCSPVPTNPIDSLRFNTEEVANA